jgi:hypothetical protein
VRQAPSVARLAEQWAKAFQPIGPEVRNPERSLCFVTPQDSPIWGWLAAVVRTLI